MPSNTDDSSSDDDSYCPALPPNFKKDVSSTETTSATNRSQTIGPVLPVSMRHLLEKGGTSESVPGSSYIPQSEESDEDSVSDSEIIGPLPPDHPLAEKAASGVLKPKDGDAKPKREEWMLVPPKNKPIAALGLGARKFLARTPADSVPDDQDEAELEEEMERQAIEQQIIDQYDDQMEKMKTAAAEKSKTGGQSLYELHQQELKRKRKDEKDAGPKERKPFDRDTDLRVTGLSSDDRMKYIKKSHELESKFTKGKRKFL